MRFSASRLSTWMSCPLKARFHYVDGLPGRTNAKAAFGSIIHNALMVYEQTGRSLEAAITAFLDGWDKVEVDYYPRFTTWEGLRDRGPRVLRDFDNRYRYDDAQVLALEHPFLVPIGDHELYGFVDRLELRKSGNGKTLLRVVDYKTNARKPFAPELTMNIQFTAYIYATFHRSFWEGIEGSPEFRAIENGEWWFQTLTDVPRRGIWSGVWTGSEHDVGERTDEDFERMHRAMDEIAKAEAAGIYVPNISGDSCGICDYVTQCRHAIPTIEEIQQQESAWL